MKTGECKAYQSVNVNEANKWERFCVKRKTKNLYDRIPCIQTNMQSHRFGQHIESIWKIIYLLFKWVEHLFRSLCNLFFSVLCFSWYSFTRKKKWFTALYVGDSSQQFCSRYPTIHFIDWDDEGECVYCAALKQLYICGQCEWLSNMSAVWDRERE